LVLTDLQLCHWPLLLECCKQVWYQLRLLGFLGCLCSCCFIHSW